jgi:hypothetical protein
VGYRRIQGELIKFAYQGLSQQVPTSGAATPALSTVAVDDRSHRLPSDGVRRIDRLGGLIHEYERVA